MSSKLRFQIYYGDYYISHDAYGVDLSAFERRECGIDKPLERSFGSILSVPCSWGTHSYCAKIRVVIRNYALRS